MLAIDLHSAIFIGHSMGSAIASSLALEHPDQTLGLGLIGSGLQLKVDPGLIEQTAHPTTFFNAVEALVSQSFSSQAPTGLTQQAIQRMAEIRHSVLHADLQACAAYDPQNRLANIVLPTLVVVGEQDRLTPLRSAHALADAIPGARLEIVPAAGHMVMLEQPQMVANVLLNFIWQIPY